jgi:hypothetical protein
MVTFALGTIAPEESVTTSPNPPVTAVWADVEGVQIRKVVDTRQKISAHTSTI